MKIKEAQGLLSIEETNHLLDILIDKGIIEKNGCVLSKGLGLFNILAFTPEEYRLLRMSIGTQQHVAELLDMEYRSLGRRENGKRNFQEQGISGEPALALLAIYLTKHCRFYVKGFPQDEEER